MANTVISPNMGLPVPVVGQDTGPDWANNINASLSILDSHNHSTGSGVQITPTGININTDFPFNGNNATDLRSTRFLSQSAPLGTPTDIGCLYESGVDLYYNDGIGNQIRITQAGSVTGATGTITGLPSGTASASYSAGVFAFESATSTPAQMNIGSLTIAQEIASGFGVNISISNSQAANYNWVLPTTLPGSSGYLQVDPSGNLTVQGVVVPGTSNGLVSLNGLTGNTTGNAIASGYVGEIIWGPANRNTGGLVSFNASSAWQQFQTITLSAGVWMITVQYQIAPGDNSTAFSLSDSIDFVISGTTASPSGINGGFACIDINSVFMSNANNNSGNIASGTLTTPVHPSTTTVYYLNAFCVYTGTAPRSRAGFTAVRIA